MAITQTVITVDSEIWRHFKAECLHHGTSPTKEIARFVATQLDTWIEQSHNRALKEYAQKGEER